MSELKLPDQHSHKHPRANSLKPGDIFYPANEDNNPEFYRRFLDRNDELGKVRYTWVEFPADPAEGYGSVVMDGNIEVIIIDEAPQK